MKVRKRPEQKHTQAHRIVLGRCESRAPRLPPLYKRDLWEVGRWEVGRWEGGPHGRHLTLITSSPLLPDQKAV